MDCAEQNSSQKINVPCLDEVKQTRGTLSNPVKYLHYIAQNQKGFEIGSPHRRRQQELCRARGKSRVPPTGAHPTAAWHFPGVPAPPGSILLLRPKGSPCSPAALPGAGTPHFKQARLPRSFSLCHTQNSRVLARRPQATLVMGEQSSRVFKINKPKHRQLGSVMLPVFPMQVTG